MENILYSRTRLYAAQLLARDLQYMNSDLSLTNEFVDFGITLDKIQLIFDYLILAQLSIECLLCLNFLL